jgi:hypothetical protein
MQVVVSLCCDRRRKAIAAHSNESMRYRISLTLCVLSLFASGCAHVAPYERERLAHATMTTEDLARVSEDHVWSVQEGAVGGSASSGGGCGCN